MSINMLYGLSWDDEEDTKPQVLTPLDLDEKDESFFRNGIACSLKKIGYQPNVPIWWAYMGFEKSHFLYGSLYHQSTSGVGLHKVTIQFNITALDAKWWMAFEGGYSKEKTLTALFKVVDSL